MRNLLGGGIKLNEQGSAKEGRDRRKLRVHAGVNNLFKGECEEENRTRTERGVTFCDSLRLRSENDAARAPTMLTPHTPAMLIHHARNRQFEDDGCKSNIHVVAMLLDLVEKSFLGLVHVGHFLDEVLQFLARDLAIVLEQGLVAYPSGG